MSNLTTIERDTTLSTAEQSQPMRLMELAITNNASVENLERLMALQERWEAGEAKKAFYAALSKFQMNCPRIEKRKQGHNYKYAPLGDIVAQIKSTLNECGLSFRFEQSHADGIEVTCVLTHNAGHSERTTMSVQPDTSGSKNSIQAIGSAVTYGQRYTLIGALGITTADEDIDGRLPQEFKKKEPYKSFKEQRGAMLNAIKQGRTADDIIEQLETDYTVTDAVKEAIRKLENSNDE